MDAATFRRYLQPSPTLRWHPWAPLVTLLLAFAFVFGLGVALGMKVDERKQRIYQYTPVFLEMGVQREAARRPSALPIRRAQTIDAAVIQLVRDEAEAGVLTRAIDRVNEWARPEHFRMNLGAALHKSVADAAEWRLANLSVGAPAWASTAAYCEEWKSAFNPTDMYERAAKAYTTLLGREITARQLAPAVPGGKCNAKERP